MLKISENLRIQFRGLKLKYQVSILVSFISLFPHSSLFFISTFDYPYSSEVTNTSQNFENGSFLEDETFKPVLEMCY